jgi:sporadic carbohydrate cluster 2OG-Fe(II) oxygenase
MPEFDDDRFVDQGWVVLTLHNTDGLERYREAVVSSLRNNWFPALERLEDYHKYVEDDEQHTKIQYEIAKMGWDTRIAQQVVRDNVEQFAIIVGLNIHVQKFPYLRIARPGCYQDNLGYHRDTHYGSSAYELSVHVPLVNLTEKSSLKVIPGSQLAPDSEYPFDQHDEPSVEKGSIKHQLGFLYAPKTLQGDIEVNALPIPIQFGQVMVFAVSMVHGQACNFDEYTRFSTDIRIVNSLAPINWSRNVHSDYYESLTSTASTRIGQQYELANVPEKSPEVNVVNPVTDKT